MSVIKSVAVAGASGNLGTPIVKALLEADFQVTVLTRSAKLPNAFDARVKIQEVDFTSTESLTSALKGVDAVVSAVNAQANDIQFQLIDAAVTAGVKRFIPSEYGSVSTNPKVESLPLYSGMWKVRKHLQEKSSSSQLTWTVLAVGAFTSFLFGTPVFLDFAKHKANLYDEGDNRVTSTSLPNIGKAVAAVLTKFDATKNKILKISEVIVTQNQIMAIAKDLKPEIKWEISKTKTADTLKEGLDDVAAGKFGVPAIMKVLAGTAMAGETYGSAFDVNDNELLGIKEMTDEELRKLVAESLEKPGQMAH